jgi:hypothetical protein
VRVLLGSLGPAAGHPEAPEDRRPAVTEATEFPASRAGEIAAWLDEHGVGPVIVVLPAAAVVCRTCALPDADPEHLAQALELQAEALPLNAVPAHRRAMAVLPGATGEMSRSGIIVDWPQGPGDGELLGAADPDARPWGNRSATFAPDVGCLGALLNGHRPDEPLLWFDRADGSLALAMSHANGVILRAARVGAAEPDAWTDNLGRVVAETALSVGHTPVFTETLVNTAGERIVSADRNAALVAPPQTIDSIRGRVDGTPDDPRWWQRYGVAVGALVAASGQLAPLTRLRLSAPVERPTRARRLLAALSDPVSAVRIAAVCVLVILLGPLVFSGLRLGILKIKLPDLETYRAEARQAEGRLAMYDALESQARPMAKLLADIACNTPEAIDLEQIRIDEDRVRVSGRARPDAEGNLTAQQVVTRMQQNLRDSEIFDDIYPSWGDPDNFGHYEFSLAAKVVNAYHRHDYPRELDYGAWTLAQRLWPEADPGPAPPEPEVVPVSDAKTLPQRDQREAPREDPRRPPRVDPRRAPDGNPQKDAQLTNPDKAAVESADENEKVQSPNGERAGRDPSRGFVRDDSRRPGRDAPAGRGTERAPGGAMPPSRDVPLPVSPAQVDAMSLPEAQEIYARISRALQQARVDDETKQRLWRDWRLVRDRVRELKQDG